MSGRPKAGGGGHKTAGRAQGKPPGNTGGNKPMKPAMIPTKDAKVTYSRPTQRQKM